MTDEGSITTTPTDRAEALRALLEREQHRPFTCDQAMEIGNSLIAFFELLGEDAELSDPEPTAEDVEEATWQQTTLII